MLLMTRMERLLKILLLRLSSTVSIVSIKSWYKSLYGSIINIYFIFLAEKEKVVEMHKEVIQQLIQQQKKLEKRKQLQRRLLISLNEKGLNKKGLKWSKVKQLKRLKEKSLLN